MEYQTYTRECKDIVNAGKLRVVVLQVSAQVEDATIESAIDDMAATLDGARASMHVIPIVPGKSFKNRVVIELSEIEPND